MISGNLPDLDVIYAPLLSSGGGLGYLLHHRGHTHTLLGALLQGALVGWGALFWLGKKNLSLGPVEVKGIWFLALLGPFVHLILDGANSYGVHPFWPFSNRWVYGDSLFIIEPLLWISLFTVPYYAIQKPLVRRSIEAVLIALFTVLWLVPLSRWYSSLAVVLLAVLSFGFAGKLKPRGRAYFAAANAVFVILVFSLASLFARAAVQTELGNRRVNSTLEDIVLQPFPSNPLCWSLITVETLAEGARYRVRRGRFSLVPSLVDASSCPRFPSNGSTVVLSPVPGLWGERFDWEGQYQVATSDLRNYEEFSCKWSQFLHFARVPYLQEDGEKLWAGDLRFDFSPEIGFSELEVTQESRMCSASAPAWSMPRGAIFETQNGISPGVLKNQTR